MRSPLSRTLVSLAGLSVGDGFGFAASLQPLRIRSRVIPPPVWRWSDDTHMALSVVEVLREHGSVEQDALAAAFARRYEEEPWRGYGQGARRLLEQLRRRSWEEASRSLFQGGSYGNGGAMRVGPLGAWFAGDLAQAAAQGRRQAEITHAHPEGQAGAIAIAVAAALLAEDVHPSGNALLQQVIEHIPRGETRNRSRAALSISPSEVERAARTLGTGREVSAQDTVPFCLWCAAHHLDSYEDALWTAIQEAEDSDTVCAIVGSLVALRSPPPEAWLSAREPLPDGLDARSLASPRRGVGEARGQSGVCAAASIPAGNCSRCDVPEGPSLSRLSSAVCSLPRCDVPDGHEQHPPRRLVSRTERLRNLV